MTVKELGSPKYHRRHLLGLHVDEGHCPSANFTDGL